MSSGITAVDLVEALFAVAFWALVIVGLVWLVRRLKASPLPARAPSARPAAANPPAGPRPQARATEPAPIEPVVRTPAPTIAPSPPPSSVVSAAPAGAAAPEPQPAAAAQPRPSHDVFVSYSSKDKPQADAICAIMEREGVRCFITPRDILPGQDWAESVLRAISHAKVVVLIFSAASNTSPQVRREIERAVHHEVAIIPVRIEDAKPSDSLEYFISTPHWLDAITPPLEAHAVRLAESVKALLAQQRP